MENFITKLSFKGNNPYKESSDNFRPIKWIVGLFLLIIFAIYYFTLAVMVFKLQDKNGKFHKKLQFKGNNSYKESSDNFRLIQWIVGLVLLIIFAIYSFTLAVIVLKLQDKNGKFHKKLPFKGNNSYKESSDNFRPIKWIVGSLLLIICAIYSFNLAAIVFKLQDKNGKFHKKLPFKGKNYYKESSDNYSEL